MDKVTLAYVIGLAIGDGNLSNPNGRAVRLRITCDTKYPKLIKRIIESIQKILPKNKVSVVHRAKTYIDISCYSNKWENLLGWKAKNGSKFIQKIDIPNWIKNERKFKIACMRGLFETDGAIYLDRGYKMAILTTIIPGLAKSVEKIISSLGFTTHKYTINPKHNSPTKNIKTTYHIRISKDVNKFVKLVKINKNNPPTVKVAAKKKLILHRKA